MTAYKVNGFALKRFELVLQLFTKNFKKGIDENAQLCVYIGKRVVVDLWGVSQSVLKKSVSYQQAFGSIRW